MICIYIYNYITDTVKPRLSELAAWKHQAKAFEESRVRVSKVMHDRNSYKGH